MTTNKLILKEDMTNITIYPTETEANIFLSTLNIFIVPEKVF